MKQKILKLFAVLLLIFTIIYMSFDSSDMSLMQCMVHTGIALVVLAFDTWLINHLGKEDGNADSNNS